MQVTNRHMPNILCVGNKHLGGKHPVCRGNNELLTVGWNVLSGQFYLMIYFTIIENVVPEGLHESTGKLRLVVLLLNVLVIF
jgi:hypothetical protein